MVNVKLLFWNLKNNPINEILSKILIERDVDVAILAEYKGISFDKVVELTDENYTLCEGVGGCDKITLVCKNEISVTIRREHSRYVLYDFEKDGIQYNLIGLHLPDQLNSTCDDRKFVIREAVRDIKELELDNKNYKTIVLGDLNCNPFDGEIVQKDSFNAVLFRSLIEKTDKVTYNGEQFRRFYNPVLLCLSETDRTYGSIYYSSGIAPLYWNSFDQVLIRKELVDAFESMEYVKTIGTTNLIKEVAPNKEISDHLPLIVSLH